MLPKVENPIPDTIGLSTIIGLAGAGGVLSLVLATILGLSDTRRDNWVKWGTAAGLFLGFAIYLLALLAQLLCRQ